MLFSAVFVPEVWTELTLLRGLGKKVFWQKLASNPEVGSGMVVVKEPFEAGQRKEAHVNKL